jgi:hypothetical protein
VQHYSSLREQPFKLLNNISIEQLACTGFYVNICVHDKAAMRTKIYCFSTVACVLLLHSVLPAQELVQVTDEMLTVNSTTSALGHTRNKAEVSLPEKVKGYIYRISIFPKGKTVVDNSLFDLLKQAGGSNISLASSFAQFAIRNNDNNAIDAFIFNNVYDAENFYARKDGSWSYCKSLLNRSSCCFATTECIGRQLFFGFRNNNIMQGLDVKLEIVAMVDTAMKASYHYSYTINNAADRELKYSISTDNIHWQESTLRNGYQQTFTFEQQEIYFRIQTGDLKMAAYKLIPNERYKIIWNVNAGKWDMARY